MNVANKILIRVAFCIVSTFAQAQSGDEIGRSPLEPAYNAERQPYPFAEENRVVVPRKGKVKAKRHPITPACVNGEARAPYYSGPCGYVLPE